MGIFSFLTERETGAEIVAMATALSFKNTASIFPEISFIQYFPLFSCKPYDVITDLSNYSTLSVLVMSSLGALFTGLCHLDLI